jgi:hypothetical protein
MPAALTPEPGEPGGPGFKDQTWPIQNAVVHILEGWDRVGW